LTKQTEKRSVERLCALQRCKRKQEEQNGKEEEKGEACIKKIIVSFISFNAPKSGTTMSEKLYHDNQVII